MRDLDGGALVAICLAIALFFLRFYRDTRDRFFILFCLAFCALAAHWGVLEVVDRGWEWRPTSYLLRLVAFLLILAAIVEKNRQE